MYIYPPQMTIISFFLSNICFVCIRVRNVSGRRFFYAHKTYVFIDSIKNSVFFLITLFFPSQHASNITYLTYLNIYNSLNQGLYLHTVFEFLGIYRGRGCSALVRMGPIAHVVQTALECTLHHGPVLLLQFVWQLKIKTLHGVHDTQKLLQSERMLLYRPVQRKCEDPKKARAGSF